MLAATGGGDGATGYPGGVYESSDGGTTWTQATVGRSFSVAWDPSNASNAIADTTSDAGGTPTTVAYTTDGGATWTPAYVNGASNASGAGHSELAYAPSAPGVVYASVDNNSGELDRSADGGQTWTVQSTGTGIINQGWYANAIWVDPTNSAHLIVGGLDLWQSINSGGAWTQISDWTQTPNSPHADHHAIVADPGYNGTTDQTVYFGNDGGLYCAANLSLVTTTTTGWTDDNNGLAITQFYSGAGHAGVTASLNNNIVPIIGGA